MLTEQRFPTLSAKEKVKRWTVARDKLAAVSRSAKVMSEQHAQQG